MPSKKEEEKATVHDSRRFVYRVKGKNAFVSHRWKDEYETYAIPVDTNMVNGTELDTEAFQRWRNGKYANAQFMYENGTVYPPLSALRNPDDKYICGTEVEKRSKSNTVNPDYLLNK